MNNLSGKKILLGVTGGIAAYKSADLVRRLIEAGAQVRVAMTQGAKAFVTPLTFQALSGTPVHEDLLDPQAEAGMGHIQLARWADFVLVAPASANFIARLAHGMADDLLTTLCLATTAPVAIAPAMNQQMWNNRFTQDNIQRVTQAQVKLFGPAAGSQACGEVGLGRLVEPEDLVKSVSQYFQTGLLQDISVLITAGPTIEAIDPVRYLTNRSTGKMGYAMAQAALEAGAKVTLVSGPTALNPPPVQRLLKVTSATEMFDAVMAHMAQQQIFIGVAAVADYRCEQIANKKIAKTTTNLTLNLTQNPDIIATVAQQFPQIFKVGFAAQTEDLEVQAQRKLKEKKLNMIAANLVGEHQGFAQDHNTLNIYWHKGHLTLPHMSKTQLARQFIALIAEHYTHQ